MDYGNIRYDNTSPGNQKDEKNYDCVFFLENKVQLKSDFKQEAAHL
jgi:hypothetical protein